MKRTLIEQKKYNINVIKKTLDFSNKFFKNKKHLLNFQFQNKNNHFWEQTFGLKKT